MHENLIGIHCSGTIDELLDCRGSSVLTFVDPSDPRPVLPLDNPVLEKANASLSKWHQARQGPVHGIKLYSLANASVGGLAYVEAGGQLLASPEFLPAHISAAKDDPRASIPSRLDLRTSWIEGPCLFFVIKGYDVYGHWLLDILPRAYLARLMLGASWNRIKLILPCDIPPFAKEVLYKYFGIGDADIIYYTRWEEKLIVKKLLVPTLLHCNYNFHPISHLIYDAMAKEFGSELPGALKNPYIYVSRKKYRNASKSYRRVFLNEDAAISRLERHGVTVHFPEDLSWSSQISLFRQPACVVGESGSALHNAVFTARPSTTLSIRPLNFVQSKISALRGTRVNYVLPTRVEERGEEHFFSIDIDEFDRAVEFEINRSTQYIGKQGHA
jgi:capsular polysaccharide biosynthesis protein